MLVLAWLLLGCYSLVRQRQGNPQAGAYSGLDPATPAEYLLAKQHMPKL